MCQQSMRCADQDLKVGQAQTLRNPQTTASASKEHLVCQDKKFLCLNKSAACDGKFDCLPHDTSDELNCKLDLFATKCNVSKAFTDPLLNRYSKLFLKNYYSESCFLCSVEDRSV